MKRHTIGSLFAVLLLFCNGCASKHKSDQEMIAQFQAHKTEFSQLLDMLKADKGLKYFAHGVTLPESPDSGDISQERRQEYQKLFTRLGLDALRDLSNNGSRDEVWFFTSIPGARQSTFKHYAYVVQPGKETVVDLDQGASKLKPYRHIEGNWYLAMDDAD
ncbi:MAG TPA: hypothetical protein PKA34_16575 [Blastocatellia bacterium]|nr:hypothetical protein [Blastocatellia bacterium]